MTPAEMQKQLVAELVLESLDGLDAFDAEMLALEESDGDPGEHLRLAFRLMHTIKGSSGCLGLEAIEKVAHAGENLLSLLRDEKITPTKSIISALLNCSDALRDMMRGLEAGQTPRLDAHQQLLALLASLQQEGEAQATQGFGFFEGAPGLSPAPSPDPSWGLFTAEAAPAPPPTPAEPPPPAAELPAAPPPPANQPRPSESAIRVEVAHIDRLMNLVGELVLARNQLLMVSGQLESLGLQGPLQRVNQITAELQAGVMKTRMQMVQTIWAKFPRLVRDLSVELGKKIALTMEGQETELDRTVIEAIKDPLTHLLRNALDHGLEDPATRRACGKPETGQVRLRAYHEGGQVVLEISDDGRGIDPARIARKALERGLIQPGDESRMSQADLLNLIFLPGFSTAEKVTNVSGRGVGMDVVRSNVERVGGSVNLSSQVGQGTTMQVRIPLTLAIVPALLVSSSGQRFAIPQANLVELVRLDPTDTGHSGVEWVDSAPVLRLRGKLLPLVNLSAVLALEQQTSFADAFVAVVESNGNKFGLVADAVLDSEEIVVKPLHDILRRLEVYAGATILGDGQVALILDVAGLARKVGVLSLDRHQAVRQDSGPARSENRLQILLARVAQNRVAFPLEAVTRIEEIPAESIERAGLGEVLQYRGGIMPLIRVSQCLGLTPQDSPSGLLQLVVCDLAGTQSGLVIDEIEDIVEETVNIASIAAGPCLAGSLVAAGRVADLIDLAKVAECSFSGNRV